MDLDERRRRKFQRMRDNLGPSLALDKFLSNYGKWTTKMTYATQLTTYFRWLREQKRIDLTPDAMLIDNLRCVFESGPVDVITKAKHTNLLSEYVNTYLVGLGVTESTRNLAGSTVRRFYETNNSQLWGSFGVAEQRAQEPPKPLEADEIRRVLLSMKMRIRRHPYSSRGRAASRSIGSSG